MRAPPRFLTTDSQAFGHADPRFAAVREAFEHNLTCKDETGAAFCLYVDGRKVVDLWGGWADLESRKAWQRDTIVNCYSIGKGILAALVLELVHQGLMPLDLRVADVWPAFAAEDKGDITLAMLLAHQAGLPAIRRPLPEGAMLGWPLICNALAKERPYWVPGSGHGYHTNTFGFLVGETLRLATGLGVSEALRTFVTGPFEADFAWGLKAADLSRVAQLYSLDADYVMRGPSDWAAAFPPTGDPAHDQMIWHTYFNPSGFSGGGVVNSEAWRRAVIPSTNGHGNARGVSRIYNALLGCRDQSGALASPELLQRACSILSDGDDIVLGRPSRFGLGFQLPQPGRSFGPNATAFGHYGFGGSLGFADPVAGLAFAYVRNRPGDRWQTPRTQALIDASYAALQ